MSVGVGPVYRIPVFGDIHGNLEGMINTLKHLERSNNERYRFALQTGDFGYYGSEQSFKAETKGRRNLEYEDGVLRYLYSDTQAQAYFGEDGVDCKILFIRGNHEDQESLARLRKDKSIGAISVDKQERILYVPDGQVIDLMYAEHRYLRIAAFGGVAEEHRPKAYKRNPLIAFDPKALNTLCKIRGVDVLLTHQGPDERFKGSAIIHGIVDGMMLKIHLHGHSHRHHANKDICSTKSFSLGHMPKSKRPFTLSSNFYGFISIQDSGVKFQLG